MNEFIGNHIQFIAHWGQLLMAMIVFLGVVFIFFIIRKNKHYVPSGIGGWFGAFLSFLIILIASLIFARITIVKPGVMVILNQLENLKGRTAPPLTFNLVSDHSIQRIEDYRGKVVLLNYWATWCAPCLKEIPDLNRLQRRYEKEGLIVIALSDESTDRLDKFARRIPFKVVAGYISTFDWVGLGSERPATFLIDKKGMVRDYFTGPYDYSFFESKILNYLNE